MLINELITAYKEEKDRLPTSMNDLLDYYQQKYITGEIDIAYYRETYYFLFKKGAVSAYEYTY
ncbi:YppF family protein [Virgibacillus halodenitrificans]|uniref:Uncharacterized protein n=1 Tax=Virgibacillus halodenitrificans TaxID=1482 RepID=A0AAC9NKA3_VIRHA|nr:YppF family protein [Virgibacillus halodenitrificans]APC47484.1 hypothetical protein BME96_04555 [Virgibacillus halodenitrificans]MCG1030167.1 hypothetical protein [Virgibacillus halodenitrificans]MEC2158618.1 YppF family protein [Virgibacillus halodenitrificans]MYL46214.1 hypothetical protein [Virgibacillus halodenitrificans]MYL56546.1 hypothetical protein [Virgibacillus halodenitrificans]